MSAALVHAYKLTPFDARSAPVWLPADCPKPGCGQRLVLDDVLDGLPVQLHLHDEWACPVHREVLLDAPVSIESRVPHPSEVTHGEVDDAVGPQQVQPGLPGA